MTAVLAMEITASRKRRNYAGILREPRAAMSLGSDDIKERLRAIRTAAMGRQAALVEQAIGVWSQNGAVKVTMAKDAQEAVRAIAGIAGQGQRIAINKSSVLRSELVPKLAAAGFRVLEPYYEQFQPFENRFTEYWQIPPMRVEFRWESFQVTGDLGVMRRQSIETHGAKDIIGVMGVNAASASDGSIILLQHGYNISDIFIESREVILVIGIDKIVAEREAAVFQTQGMALYGSESLLLDLQYREAPEESFEKLPFTIPLELVGRTIHLILLDNGRSQLLESRYRDLLLCIDCRACMWACPVGQIESRQGIARRSPREYVYLRALQMNSPPRACLQCRRCESVCPGGIELPDLILEASGKAGLKLPGALADCMLRNPETLLRRASTLSVLYNFLTGIGVLRWFGEKTMGIAGSRRPPRVHRNTFRKWFRSYSREVSAGARDDH